METERSRDTAPKASGSPPILATFSTLTRTMHTQTTCLIKTIWDSQ